jgi:hypothetical protein
MPNDNINDTVSHVFSVIRSDIRKERDKEWVEWAESSMNLDRYYSFQDCQDRCDGCTGVGQRNCNWRIWKERKKEVCL